MHTCVPDRHWLQPWSHVAGGRQLSHSTCVPQPSLASPHLFEPHGLGMGVQQVPPLQTWPLLQPPPALLHSAHRPEVQHRVLVWPAQPLSAVHRAQVPLLQAGLASGQSALPAHCSQAPLLVHLALVLLEPLRLEHSISPLGAGAQPRQVKLVPSQMGAVVEAVHWVLVVQATQAPPPGRQWGVAGRPAQSASFMQPMQVLLAEHTGVLPPQSLLARHCTHLPAAGPAIGHSGRP
jgi:hypothetical protein